MRKILSMILILTMGAALLAGCGGSSQGTGTAGTDAAGTGSSVSAADSAATEVPEGSYVIYVLDEESGDPIEGVIVQFCSDTECRTGTSDAAGKAVFEARPSLKQLRATTRHMFSRRRRNTTWARRNLT